MGRVAAVAAALLALPAGAHAAAGGSLYSGPGPRPGPDILYSKPPKPAPQLRNRGPWRAKPILVSGSSAYRRGEFLYQDYIYDDHGAKALARDPNDPRTEKRHLLGAERHLHLSDRPRLPRERRRPRRAAGQAAGALDRLPADA